MLKKGVIIEPTPILTTVDPSLALLDKLLADNVRFVRKIIGSKCL